MDQHQTIFPILRNLHVFGPCSDDEIRRLAVLMTREVSADFATLYSEGDTAATAYIVENGHIRLFRRDDHGNRTTVATLGPGDLFGERSVFANERRRETAVSFTEATVLYQLTRDDFDVFLSEFPHHRRHFAQAVKEGKTSDYLQIMPELNELTRGLFIFSRLHDDDILMMTAMMSRVRCLAGDIIFQYGDEADCAYLMYSGRVRIFRAAPGEKGITFATLGRGDLFGERSILKNEVRSATAEVLTDNAVLCKILKEDFEDLVERFPQIREHLYDTIEVAATTNYLRVLFMRFLRQRFGLLMVALIILIFALSFPLSSFRKASVKTVTKTARPVALVEGMTVSPETVDVTWSARGTVEPARVVTLPTQIHGTITSAAASHPGQTVPAGTPLFRVDTTMVDYEAQGLQSQLEQIAVNERNIKAERRGIEEQIAELQKLDAVAQTLLQLQSEKIDLHSKNYESNKVLYEKKQISQAMFLVEEVRGRDAGIAMANAEKNQIQIRRDYLQLKQKHDSGSLALEELALRRQQLRSQLDILNYRRDPARLSFNFDCRIIETQAKVGQSVNAGAVLATVRPADSVTIPVTIPNTYFKWLYQGDLFAQAGAPNTSSDFKIVLTNHHFDKTFSGGYLLSIDQQVDPASRSLRVVIGRDNPRDVNGRVIPTEELLPGMACRVELPLYRVHNVYVVPRHAVQENGNLCSLTPSSEPGKHLIHVIQDPEIIQEIPRGLVYRLPAAGDPVSLITHPFPNAFAGTEVRWIQDVDP